MPVIDFDRLAEAAAESLRRGDPTAARAQFRRVLAARPGDVAARLGLAVACRECGDRAGHLAALEEVIALDPANLFALLMKADYCEREGDSWAAHRLYNAVVERAPPRHTLPPELQAEVMRAEAASRRQDLAYEAHLRETIRAAGLDPDTASPRFALSLDVLCGRKQIYHQAPTAYYFPELPQRQFYERDEFPWLASIEAQTEAIREEFLEVMREPSVLHPYVQTHGAAPPAGMSALADRLDWGAYDLIRAGTPAPAAVERCPRTFAALRSAPLCAAPGRTPSVIFSVLQPGVRIPPHTGYTNARLICHLPLVIPGAGGLRVGSAVRHWKLGEALIFDDSIEHEAWNDSAATRAVLIFDIWRPELSTTERDLVAAMLSAVGTLGAAAWDEGAPAFNL